MSSSASLMQQPSAVSAAVPQPGAPAQHSRVGLASERLLLAVALLMSALFMARTMAPALQSADLVQSDAREHTIWTARYRDPELFRGDLIAEYFQSVAPPGYSALYWLLSQSIEPLLASKLVPLALGLIVALLQFALVRRLHPSPAAAFLATILLSWYVWQYDDLASGTPRSFLLPFLLAQLWALVSGRLALAAVLVGLSALFYPVAAMLGVTLLGTRLVVFQGGRPGVARRRSDWLALLVGALLAGALLLPNQVASAKFGPVVTAAQARQMPEFGPFGHKTFFVDDPYRYWVASVRSGLDLRITDALMPGVPILAELLALAMLLPVLIFFRRQVTGVNLLSGRATILLRLLAGSFGLFLLAHLLLFRLYLPGRYAKTSVLLVLAIAAGGALGILVDTIAARQGRTRRQLVAGGLALGLAAGLAVYPAHYDGNFTRDRHPNLTAYLRDQPKDVLIAGVPDETDAIPAFASRMVLTSREFALPYHLGFYEQIRRRTEALIDGYYAKSPADVAAVASQYGVDLFLVNSDAFSEATFRSAWNLARSERPLSDRIERKIERKRPFALLEAARRCAVFRDGKIAVVPTSCLSGQG